MPLEDIPADDLVEILVTEPPDTPGAKAEEEAVRTLHRLCDTHGYGRITQLVQQMSAIWRDPNKTEEFLEEKARHLNVLAQRTGHSTRR